MVDSSDDDTPLVMTRSATPARPSHRLVLVPESEDATSQSIQDRGEAGTSFSLSTRGPEFSVRERHPRQCLSRIGSRLWMRVQQKSRSVGSTESDTISLAGEARKRRRRLSLVWDTHENPDAREEGESEGGSSAGSDVGEMPEVDEVVDEPVLFSPVNLDVMARNVAMGMAQFGRG